MNLKLNDVEFKDIKDLLGGFITETDKDLKFNLIASPNLSFNVAMQLLQSMTINLLTAFIEQKPEAKNDVYDAYNFMASSVLNNLIPDKELRMDVTEEAILNTEIATIEKKYDALSEDEKKKALEQIDTIKKRLANGKSN